MRLSLLATAVIAALLVFVAVAAASPAQVIADYREDGAIDGTYTLQELNGALAIAYRTRSAAYGATADAIRAAQDEIIGGVHRRQAPSRTPGPAPTDATTTDTKVTAPGAAGGPSGNGGGDAGVSAPGIKKSQAEASPSVPLPVPVPAAISAAELPSPPVARPGDRVPWLFVVLSSLAGLLAVAGIGAAVLRRVRPGGE